MCDRGKNDNNYVKHSRFYSLRMAYSSIEKLNEIEKKACENLMVASVSSSTTEKEFLKIAENYRTDMPSMVGILREYKELIAKLKEDNVNS